VTRVGGKDVIKLDITMNHMHSVQAKERASNLSNHSLCEELTYRLSNVLFKVTAQRAIFYKLHDHVVIVGALKGLVRLDEVLEVAHIS